MEAYHEQAGSAIVSLLGNLLCQMSQAAVLQQVVLSMRYEAYVLCWLQMYLRGQLSWENT